LKHDSRSRFQPAASSASEASFRAHAGEAAFWFVFQAGKLLVKPQQADSPQPVAVPVAASPEEVGLEVSGRRFLGRLDGQACWAAEADSAQAPPPGLEFQGLRGLLAQLPEELFSLAGRAAQIIDWDRNHRYCGRCGAPTEEQIEDRSKRCPSCGLVSYPRISPAVIVAVTRGDRLLLASNRRHAGVLYSVLAGFVEPGESLEECVHREIREEVSIEVTALRYFGSQPWPFPNSLMIAFTAEHAAGEIVVDPGELIEAGWFPAAKLPRIPECGTIARRLIDWFVEARRG
jgi:NAD+ diphosphatase